MSYLCSVMTRRIFYEKSLSDIGILGHNVWMQPTELKHIKTHLVTHMVRSSLVSCTQSFHWPLEEPFYGSTPLKMTLQKTGLKNVM